MPSASPRKCLAKIVADETPATEGPLHLYGRYAPLYDYLFTVRYDYDPQRDMVLESASPASDPWILEAGSGRGQLLARLDSEYDRVGGVYLSERMLSLAEERVESETLHRADLGTMPLAETYGALVMIWRVICHPDSTAAVRDLLGNCLAALREDPRLLVDFYDRDGLSEGKAGSVSGSLPPEELTVTATHEFLDANQFDWSYEHTVTDDATGRSGTLVETAGPGYGSVLGRWTRCSRTSDSGSSRRGKTAPTTNHRSERWPWPSPRRPTTYRDHPGVQESSGSNPSSGGWSSTP